MKDNITLNSFLKFGYFLNFTEQRYQINFDGIDKEKYKFFDLEELINHGSYLLRNSFDKLVNNNTPYLIPLSGGADSRVLLGMLLEHRAGKDIFTYTFGTPGTYDYDIGNVLAKKYGTKHVSFNLWKHTYTKEALLETAKRIDHQSPLLLHPPLKELDNRFGNAKVLSGVNAGAVVGSFVPDHPARSMDEAKLRFNQKAQFTRSFDLHRCKDHVFNELMMAEAIDPLKLTYDEQIYFNERSIKHLAPHVLFRGFDYILPFINTEFMDFMLSIDNRFRRNKFLYKKILKRLFPKMFSLPIEGNYALPIDAPPYLIAIKRYSIKFKQAIHNKAPKLFPYTTPMVNYLDFNRAFREKNDLKKIVKDAVFDLNNRKITPWIDVGKIWKAHQDGGANYSDVLLILFSLEIHLQAGKKLYE